MSSSVSPKLEDFLGASTAMALSLDNSSFYYGGGHGHGHHAHGHGHDQGGYPQPLQCAVIPGSGGHDVYGGHAQLVDEQSAAAAMAASWYSARGGSGGGYDVNGAGAIVPLQGHPHPLALSMSSGTGSQSSSVTMQAGVAHADAVTEYVAVDGSKKRGGGGGGGGQKQPTVHRKSIDTFGQRTSQYRGVTRYSRVSPLPTVRTPWPSLSRPHRPARCSLAAWFPPCKSRHRWTGRYEAHLWDNSCRKEGQTRKGRQGTRHCRHGSNLRQFIYSTSSNPVLDRA